MSGSTSTGAGGSANLGPWASARLPASWRGVPFAVRESEIKRGRRTAVHEYVMRDDVWVEDLGRATRVTSFRGFLVGNDVDQQLQAMLAANEMPGEGTVVHPALGSLTGSLIEFAARDSAEHGRVWELEFVFITGSARLYPNAAVDTQSAVEASADDAETAEDDDFGTLGDAISDGLSSAAGTISAVGSTVANGLATAAQAAQGVVSTVNYYGGIAQSVVQDAKAAAGSVTGLVGNFGRFSLGARLSLVPGLANVTQAIAVSNAATASVGRLAAAASAAADAL